MTKNTIVYPLKSVPTRKNLKSFVSETVWEKAGDVHYKYTLSQEIPEGQPPYIEDQLIANKRDYPEITFLTIEME